MATIKVRRGLAAGLPTLAVGELGFTTDTRFLYVGSAAGNICIGPPNSEELLDAVMGAFSTTDTVTVTYDDPADTVHIDVRHQQSITSDPWGGIKLVGDSATPGNNKVYGTDGSGNKGWQSPSAYTNEQACDAVANLLVQTGVDGYSPELQWTYDDGNDHLWALLHLNSVGLGKLQEVNACSVLGRAANSTGDVGVIASTGSNDVLRRNGTTLGFGQITLSHISGNVPADRGGTGITSYTTGDILYASDSSTLAKLPKGTTGQVLTQGATVPEWDDVPNLTHPTETSGTSSAMSSDYTLTTTTTAIGLNVTLPDAGTYLVTVQLNTRLQLSAGIGQCVAQVYNTTDAAVAGADTSVCYTTVGQAIQWGTFSISWIVAVHGGSVGSCQ